jgi:hypothetical protein
VWLKEFKASTELFNSIKNEKTPIIVERIVNDIDGIVKIVRFDGWQNTTAGRQEVTKTLRSVVWVKYKIKDNDVFNKAYSYIEDVLLSKRPQHSAWLIDNRGVWYGTQSSYMEYGMVVA